MKWFLIISMTYTSHGMAMTTVGPLDSREICERAGAAAEAKLDEVLTSVTWVCVQADRSKEPVEP